MTPVTEVLAGLEPGVVAELLSAHDARFLQHRGRELDGIRALAGRYAVDGVPTHVEIGANRGSFLEGIARSHPDERVLGIEWRPKHVRMANERMERRGLTNAEMFHADAKIAVPILFPPASVRAFYVLFPDPWWKARHAERRLLDPVFLRVLARRLEPGGRLYLKSDVFDYLYRVRACAEASRAFVPLHADAWPSESTWRPSTRERKCMSTAIPFGRGYYRVAPGFDRAFPDAPESNDDFPVPEEIDPEAIIRGPAPADREAWRKRKA